MSNITTSSEAAAVLEELALNSGFEVMGFVSSNGLFFGRDVRKLHESGMIRRAGESYRTNFKTIIGDDVDAFAGFSGWLETKLQPFLVDGFFGNGTVWIMGGSRTLTVKQYAERLIRGAVSLGGPAVIAKVEAWLAGEPARVKRRLIFLNRLSEDQHVLMKDGLRLERVPPSSDLVSAFVYPGARTIDPMGMLMLSVDVECSAFAKPDDNDRSDRRLVAGNSWPNLDAREEDFSMALSLACNCHVTWLMSATDTGEDGEIYQIGGGSSMTGKPVPFVGTVGFDMDVVTPDHLEDAQQIYNQLLAATSDLQRAITRWLKSKIPTGPIDDRLIDLRIAMESLYGGGHELRFKVATCGARHLGGDPAQRKRYQQLFLKAYDAASRAVHPEKSSKPRNFEGVLKEGQDACRLGILKCLNSGDIPSQDELLFGDCEQS